MKKLTHEEISKMRYRPEELQTGERFPIYGLLDNVRSLYNVGSIFRAADGARLSMLYLCGYTPHPPRKEIDKTALGSTATVPWQHFRDPLDAISELRASNVRICLVEQTDKSQPYYSLSKNDFPLCLVIGNEITGVSKEFLPLADMAIDIPMYGMKQSLNVAVAFGITAYDCVRVLRSI